MSNKLPDNPTMACGRRTRDSSRQSDRLKAAQILLNSVGVGQADGSVFNAIQRRFATPKLQGTHELRKLQNFWGKELIPDPPELTPEELEWRRRLQEQRVKDDKERGWETGELL